jgi:DNA polymerase-3 subunit delta'
MLFKDIPGLEDVKKDLVDAVKRNRISHAQLFIGIEDSAALPMAIAYAQYISCTQRGETDSCGICVPCKQFNSFNYPDMHFSYPVASDSSVGSRPKSKDFLKQWQGLMQEKKVFFNLHNWLEFIGLEKKQALISVHESAEILHSLSLKSYSGAFKFQLIYCADRLNTAAANKLLKVIEEPEEKTVLILITERPEAILKTIESRCQKTYIGKSNVESLGTFLENTLSIDPLQAKTAAYFAEGSVTKAMEMAANQSSLAYTATLFANWMRACYVAKVQLINDSLEPLLAMDRDSQKDFLAMTSKLIQERLLANYTEEESNPIFKTVAFDGARFSALLEAYNTELILNLLNEASYDISRNGNAKIIFLDMSLKMSNALKTKQPIVS